MGIFLKLIDSILFLYFLLMSLIPPLMDAQLLVPATLYPDQIIHLKEWYIREYGDYLMGEKPNFFVGIVWLEMLFQWPLSIVCLFGLLGGKPWFSKTCLMYGVSVLTSMAAILGELMGSGRASDKLLKTYSPFMGVAVLAILRGLVSSSRRMTPAAGKGPALARKKRA